MNDTLTRIFEDMVGRISGPMHFRLLIQPLTAIIFALRDGRKDACEGRPPYFWSILTDPGHRRDLIWSAWNSVGKVFVIAVILDAIYQYIELRWFYLGEALAVAFLLAIVPYLLLRGSVNRLASRQR